MRLNEADGGTRRMIRKLRPETVTVLLSSVGRRSQLIECFRQALSELGVSGRIVSTDAAPETAPAAYLTDKCFAVKRCYDPGFIDDVLKIAIEEDVCLIIPTIDTELSVYAANRQRFLEHGISIAVSDPETVRIACDKSETHRWLLENGFPAPRQDNLDEVLRRPEEWKFPLIIKPRLGSASAGVFKVKSLLALREHGKGRQNLIVQEIAPGDEYTVNIFVQDGRCGCAVPHRRLETRGGEVSKGITVRDSRLMRLAIMIGERLPGARGALNVQCFVDSDGAINVIEINARFGGGFPLANRAGAKFPLWLLESLLEKPSTVTSEWQDGLLMLRYDDAVFVLGAFSAHE
jgi:carbamoyl-phosphate synthase large subunit